ncbi:MAG: Peptidase flavivirus helicase [Acidobacteriales bacterium]|nr:Peptidase flavivirus helicase [Terriglobales bacterium]
MILGMALGSALSASAQQREVRVYRDGNAWVEETTGTLAAGKGFRLQAAQGAVQVRGGSQQNITYTIKKRVNRSSEQAARHDMASFTVTAKKGPDAVYIDADWAQERSGKLNAEFFINVPKETNWVKVETRGGSVGVNGISGKVDAATAGGSITADDIGQSVIANTMGGSIDVGRVGGDAKLETQGGSINIGSVGGWISASTSGGSIQVGTGSRGVTVDSAGGSISVTKCNGELRATTAGGTIDIGDVGGGAHLESMGGGIRLASAKGIVSANTASGGIRLMNLTSGVRAETMAGPIEAEFIAGRGQFTESHLDTTVGDIVVYLPSDLAVTIRAAIDFVNGHTITSEFEGLKKTSEGGQYGPREMYADGKINGGGPILKLHTTNGNIEIRKSKSRK